MGCFGLIAIGLILYFAFTTFDTNTLIAGFVILMIIGIVIKILQFTYKLLKLILAFVFSKTFLKIIGVVAALVVMGETVYLLRAVYLLTTYEICMDFIVLLVSALIVKFGPQLIYKKHMLSIGTVLMVGIGFCSVNIREIWSMPALTVIIKAAYGYSLLNLIVNWIRYKWINKEFKGLEITQRYIKLQALAFIMVSAIASLIVISHIGRSLNWVESYMLLPWLFIAWWRCQMVEPKKAYQLLGQHIDEEGRIYSGDITNCNLHTRLCPVKFSEQVLQELTEKLIEDGSVIAVDNRYYSVAVYTSAMQSLLNQKVALDEAFVTAENLYKYINHSLSGKRLKPLSDNMEEIMALSSFPVDVKCGLTAGDNVVFVAESNPYYNVCEYCGVLEKSLNLQDIKYCSLDCKNADEYESDYLRENVAINDVQYVTSEDLFNELKAIDNLEVDSSTASFARTLTVFTTPAISTVIDKDHMMATPQGHGFAAEEANTLIDSLQGKEAKVVGYDNVKSGADRMVDNILIQTKYYKTASQSIQAGFENGQYKYLRSNGKPMQIEVPADQYAKAVYLMKKRIAKGEVPGIKDPRYAHRMVRKGHLTYAQSQAVAKAGTVESITFDIAEGSIVSLNSAGITGAISFANSLWNGKPLISSLKDASLGMVSVYGQDIVKTVVAKQITKSAIGSVIRKNTGTIVTQASEIILPKTVASTIGALAKQNVITGTVSAAFMSITDIGHYTDGKLSSGELAGNVISNATTVGGAILGGELIGSAIGTLIPIPGAGTIVGGIVGGAIGNALDSIFRTDVSQKERDEQIRREVEREWQLAEQRRIEEENKRIKNIYIYSMI